MNSFLIIGIILFFGFVLGQEFKRLRLPKIIGYLLAGIILNPQICHFIPKTITSDTDIIENIAIAFIAFAIGGTMVFPEIKKLGKGIFFITIFEAEVTFLAITAGFIILLPLVTNFPQASWFAIFIPFALLLGCLGSPTDPSVALAVTHEYKAKGKVSSTMLNIAGFDDVLGIINYSVAIVIAQSIIAKEAFSVSATILTPIFILAGSVLLGSLLGVVFNFITTRIAKQSEGVFFVLILSFLTLCWGLATLVHAEEILSIMVMGIIVTNYNKTPEKIFPMLERYSEELIFLIFFVLSGMHLDFGVPHIIFVLIIFFVVIRIIGKYAGTALGAKVAGAPPMVRKYTASGLIPFGGIVIGLALMLNQNPAFKEISNYLISIIVGGTIINEFIGPLFV
ncbi:MAG: cation:proton antiporter, partial [Candidatus Omnitrophica bacterium]|nr:cation:proton antiporter [Candidatus Omnitrophota bacterium]